MEDKGSTMRGTYFQLGIELVGGCLLSDILSLSFCLFPATRLAPSTSDFRTSPCTLPFLNAHMNATTDGFSLLYLPRKLPSTPVPSSMG